MILMVGSVASRLGLLWETISKKHKKSGCGGPRQDPSFVAPCSSFGKKKEEKSK